MKLCCTVEQTTTVYNAPRNLQKTILLTCVLIKLSSSACMHDWGLTPHSTLYRSFWGNRLQSHHNHSTVLYNMNCRQPPLGQSQRKGPSVTKTQSAGPISCLEHSTTSVLHCTIVTRAAVLMFPLYSSVSTNQMKTRKLIAVIGAWFSRLLQHLAVNGVGLF